MTSAWDKFEAALKNKGSSFEKLKGESRDDKIEELIRACGINNIFEVTEVLTKFKKCQGTFS